jgi:hypothetical protein
MTYKSTNSYEEPGKEGEGELIYQNHGKHTRRVSVDMVGGVGFEPTTSTV